jgi:anaerobic selenocysteine-containing dehydrogenase
MHNEVEKIMGHCWGDSVESICWGGSGCHGGCGVILIVKEGKLDKIEGNPDIPYNQGRLCAKIMALPQLFNHPDRLKYPMKRVGERGEGKWQRITWDEAYDFIVERLSALKNDYGPESVVFLRGTGRDITAAITLLAYTYGSPNMGSFLSGLACYMPRMACIYMVSGGMMVTDSSQFFPDRYNNPNWKNPECMMIWGNNPIVSNANAYYGHWVVDSMKRGSKLIVIDPRLTWIAARANVWLQLRPGTDTALGLGLLNVIINEGLYDKEFVEKWTVGFDELKQWVQTYTPEKVSEITWVPAEEIREAARLYAKSKPAAIEMGNAVDMNKEGLGATHAVQCLWSITGNVDVPGGNIFAHFPYGITTQAIGWKFELLSMEQRKNMIGTDKYPLMKYMGYTMCSPDALIEQMQTGKPYPIKGAWIQTTNPLGGTGQDPLAVYDILKKLDFVAVVDLFMTPTAMLADIVLPGATFAERNSVTGKSGHPFATINKALTFAEAKTDWEINLDLAKRLNPPACPYEKVEDVLDEMLKPSGMTFKELREKGPIYTPLEYRKHEKGLLRPDRKPGFNTPTGKIELYNKRFQTFGLEPLPAFEEPPESPISTPELLKEYPLILTTGAKTVAFFHSEHRQIPWLREINPDPIVEIHPDTAKSLGIGNGEWVWIETKRGRCKQKAKLTLGIDPRVITAQHGWWFPEEQGAEPSLFKTFESNINVVVHPYGFQGKAGLGAPLKAMLCKVYKAV